MCECCCFYKHRQHIVLSFEEKTETICRHLYVLSLSCSFWRFFKHTPRPRPSPSTMFAHFRAHNGSIWIHIIMELLVCKNTEVDFHVNVDQVQNIGRTAEIGKYDHQTHQHHHHKRQHQQRQQDDRQAVPRAIRMSPKQKLSTTIVATRMV